MTGIMQTMVMFKPINLYDALLYVDAGNSSSYSGTGTTWTGLSNNAHNVTLVGSPTYNSSNSGYLNFNGTGAQYGDTVESKFNTVYTGKSLIVTVRMTGITTGTFRCIFGTNSGSRNFNTYIYSPSSGVYQLHYSAGSAGGFSNNLSWTTGQWAVFAVTHNTDGLVTYYHNGVPVGTNTGVTFAQYASNGGEFIGIGDNYWYGDIAVCAVFGRTLSSDEITQNFNSLKSRYGL